MDKNFPQGFYADKREKTPDFVVCSVAIDVAKFMNFLRSVETTEKGYIYIDVLKSKKEQGKIYATMNEWWKKDRQPKQDDEIKPDEIPF